jgi:ribonuclease R
MRIKLIEECMIAANVEAAKFLLRKRIPAPYRVHDRRRNRSTKTCSSSCASSACACRPLVEVTPGRFRALLRKVRKRAGCQR